MQRRRRDTGISSIMQKAKVKQRRNMGRNKQENSRQVDIKDKQRRERSSPSAQDNNRVHKRSRENYTTFK